MSIAICEVSCFDPILPITSLSRNLRHDGLLKVRDFRLSSGSVINAALKYSVYFQGDYAEAFSKSVVIVHPALTGTSKMFDVSTDSKFDGWGAHLKSAKSFDLSENTVLVVEPLAGNGRSSDQEFPCAADELSAQYGLLEYRPADTVALVQQLLKDNRVGSVDKLICFSMGGVFMPAWLSQSNVQIKQIDSIYSGFQIPELAREFWQIQIDLLNDQPEDIDFKNLSRRLVENFGNKDFTEAQDNFSQVVRQLANEIRALPDQDDYALSALKLARKISFLRFQTPERFAQSDLSDCFKYLRNQEAAIVGQISIANYSSLLENLLAKDDLSDIQQNPKIRAVFNSQDMLYAQVEKVHGGLSIEAIRRDSVRGHDAFLSPKEEFVTLLS